MGIWTHCPLERFLAVAVLGACVISLRPVSGSGRRQPRRWCAPQNDQAHQLQILDAQSSEGLCKIVVQLVLVSTARVSARVFGFQAARQRVQEPSVTGGSTGTVSCHVRGRNQQPGKDGSFDHPDVLSTPPEFKKRSRHDVFGIVVVSAQPVGVAKDPVPVPVVQDAKSAALTQKAPAPQLLIPGFFYAPHAL